MCYGLFMTVEHETPEFYQNAKMAHGGAAVEVFKKIILLKNYSREHKVILIKHFCMNKNFDKDILSSLLDYTNDESSYCLENITKYIFDHPSFNEDWYEIFFKKTGSRYIINRNNVPRKILDLITDTDPMYVLDYYTNDYFSDQVKNAFLNHKSAMVRNSASQKFGEKSSMAQENSPGITSKITQTISDELPEVGIRIAAKQMVKLTCAPIEGICTRFNVVLPKNFIRSQYGKSLVGLILSEGLKFRDFEDDRANVIKNSLAKELRVEAFATSGNEVIDSLKPIIMDALKQILESKNNLTDLVQDVGKSTNTLLNDGMKIVNGSTIDVKVSEKA